MSASTYIFVPYSIWRTLLTSSLGSCSYDLVLFGLTTWSVMLLSVENALCPWKEVDVLWSDVCRCVWFPHSCFTEWNCEHPDVWRSGSLSETVRAVEDEHCHSVWAVNKQICTHPNTEADSRNFCLTNGWKGFCFLPMKDVNATCWNYWFYALFMYLYRYYTVNIFL